MSLLEIRNKAKAKKPNFLRQDIHKKKKLAPKWRLPRGIDSKVRLQLRGRRAMVKPGYGSPKEVKGLNRAGFKEVLVSNVADLKKVVEGCIGIVARTVGNKKKLSIVKEAEKNNVSLGNVKKTFVKTVEDSFSKKGSVKKEKVAVKKVASKTKTEDKTTKKEEVKESKSKEDLKKEKDKILTQKGSM